MTALPFALDLGDLRITLCRTGETAQVTLTNDGGELTIPLYIIRHLADVLTGIDRATDSGFYLPTSPTSSAENGAAQQKCVSSQFESEAPAITAADARRIAREEIQAAESRLSEGLLAVLDPVEAGSEQVESGPDSLELRHELPFGLARVHSDLGRGGLLQPVDLVTGRHDDSPSVETSVALQRDVGVEDTVGGPSDAAGVAFAPAASERGRGRVHAPSGTQAEVAAALKRPPRQGSTET